MIFILADPRAAAYRLPCESQHPASARSRRLAEYGPAGLVLWDWIAANGLPEPRRYGPEYADSRDGELGPITGWAAEWDCGPQTAMLSLSRGRLSFVEISVARPGVVEADYSLDDPVAPLALRVLLLDYTPQEPRP